MSSPYVNQFISGLTSPKGNVGDFQHASRMFVDSNLRLAPKTKFLFHVSFNINPSALNTMSLKYQHQNEINMLVKKCELPKFNIVTETLNQYNRKSIVQVRYDYNPINISFHDDNLGVVSQLWQNYYGYYNADPQAAALRNAYQQNAMLGAGYQRASFGLDNFSSVPFFEDITIYQMSQGAYDSYKLINPKIIAWNHDSMDYGSSQPAEQTMQLAYEAVQYDQGIVSKGNPPGFAQEHYDNTPSPLTVAGGGTRTLFGRGGVLAGIEQVFGALGSGKAFESPAAFIGTAIKAVNTYQNSKNLSSNQVRSEFGNIAVRGLTSLAVTGISGVNNVSFPVRNPTATTTASPVNLRTPGGGA